MPIIYVDADACPGEIRDLLIKTAYRLKITTIFVSNKHLGLQLSELIQHQLVAQGADVADGVIAELAIKGDLVVTQDIPLAHILVNKEVVTLSPYGQVFDDRNIGERLSMRNTLADFREVGAITGGPKPFDAVTKRNFANALDRALHRLLK